MKKKIFLCLLCLPVLFGITGCGNEKNNDMIDTKNNKSIEEKKPKVVSGDGKTIGDEVCLGKECFYVIKYDFNKEDIYLLAKYNLNAGGYYESTISDFKEYEEDEVTGLQDSSMNYVYDEFPQTGLTEFSTDKEHSNEAYSEYEGSRIQRFVDQYQKKLEEDGYKIRSSSLLDLYDIKEAFDCEWTDATPLGGNGSRFRCSSLPEYMNNRSYWTKTVDNEYLVFGIYTGSDTYQSYYNSTNLGIRPVIVISSIGLE